MFPLPGQAYVGMEARADIEHFHTIPFRTPRTPCVLSVSPRDAGTHVDEDYAR